jgi:hypothetical protein
MCGNFNVVSWSGTITEVDADPVNGMCNGTASLDLDSTTGPNSMLLNPMTGGGCSIKGGFNEVQSGTICGQWGGPWSCTGSVDTNGIMTLNCACITPMPGQGTFAANMYTGTWNFAYTYTDPTSGDTYTDTATGAFQLNNILSGSQPSRRSP